MLSRFWRVPSCGAKGFSSIPWEAVYILRAIPFHHLTKSASFTHLDLGNIRACRKESYRCFFSSGAFADNLKIFHMRQRTGQIAAFSITHPPDPVNSPGIAPNSSLLTAFTDTAGAAAPAFAFSRLRIFVAQ